MQTPTTFKARARGLMLALAITATGVMPVTVLAAEAATAEQGQSYSINAGPLERALNQFALAAGVELSVAASLTEGKNSAGLSGQHSLQQGLQTLLSGTGIGFELNGKTVTLMALANDDVMVMDAVKIESSVITESAYGPVEGYIATRSATGTKTDAALKEVPRSISVVSRDQLTAQNVANMSEALRYTAGIFSETNGVNSRGAVSSARGFAGVEYHIDGMSMDQSATFPIPDTYGLERVSVMRGPSSTLYGSGSLGGVVDVTTKRPTEEPLREVQLLTGSYELKEGRFDISDAIAGKDNLHYRLTGVWRDSGSQIDKVDDDKQFIAPVINWKPSDATDLTLLGYYQKDSGGNLSLRLPIDGSLRPNPFGTFDNGTFFGEPERDYFETKTTSVAWDIEHSFNEQWSVKHQARYTDSSHEQSLVAAGGLLTNILASGPLPILFPGVVADQPLPATIAFIPPLFGGPPLFNVPSPFAGFIPLRTVIRIPAASANTRHTITTDTHLMGEVMTGAAVKHNLLFGLDYSKKLSKFTNFNPDVSLTGGLLNLLNTLLPLDAFNPVYGQTPIASAVPSSIRPRIVKQTGLYFQDRITINEKLIVTLGVRQDDYKDDQFDKLSATANFRDLDETHTTYQGGVNYLFDAGFTPYLSYSESFVPQSGKGFNDKPFEPTTGTQYEVGIKYELPSQKVSATLSYFDLARNNLSILDPDPTHTGCTVGQPLSTCNKAAGEVVSKGVELEVKAMPIPEVIIMASYSTNDVHVTIDDDPILIGKSLTNQPEKQASLWAMYRFYGGALEGFGVSGGARYIGPSYGDTLNTIEVPSYSLLDLGLYYSLDGGFDVALNVSNVTDKQYLASCGTSTCAQGLQRKITGTATYRW